MKTLFLKSDYVKQAEALEGKFAHPSNAIHILREDTRVITPDGSTAAVYLRGVIPNPLHRRAYKLLKTVKGVVGNRAKAIGTVSLARSINKNGIASPRHGVNEIVLHASPARQGILGYKNPGELTTLTLKHPEMLDENRALIELADRLYAEHAPTYYAKQHAALEHIPWKLWDTVFVNAYVAKNFRTAFHRDGNMRGMRTVITPLGKFSGGALVLLRWRVAIPYQPGDVVIFDAEDPHGNLLMEGQRVSIALYCPRWIAAASIHAD